MSGTVGMDVAVAPVDQVAAVTGCVVLAVLAGPGGKSNKILVHKMCSFL